MERTRAEVYLTDCHFSHIKQIKSSLLEEVVSEKFSVAIIQARKQKPRNVIWVAEGWIDDDNSDGLVGLIIWEILKGQLKILNFALDPVYFWPAGRAMLDRIISRVTGGGRPKITAMVRERATHAQLLFQEKGFWAIGCQRDFYKDTGESAILFEYLADYEYEEENEVDEETCREEFP